MHPGVKTSGVPGLKPRAESGDPSGIKLLSMNSAPNQC